MFDPADFFQLAASLSNKHSASEAELRTSVSRSYYAGHLSAREKLNKLGRFAPTLSGADHAGVKGALANMGRTDLRDFLDDLHKWRTNADYRLQAPVGRLDAQKAAIVAQLLLGEFTAIK